jgi:hypothetical protein
MAVLNGKLEEKRTVIDLILSRLEEADLGDDKHEVLERLRLLEDAFVHSNFTCDCSAYNQAY